MTDKNKNNIPDWVEKAIYYSSAVYILTATFKKVLSGEASEDALKVLAPSMGGENDSQK